MTATPPRRRTARVAGETVPARAEADRSAGPCGVARGLTVADVAAVAGGARESPGGWGSYAVLLLDPVVDLAVQVGASGEGRVGAVQVGAIGLAAESVPK